MGMVELYTNTNLCLLLQILPAVHTVKKMKSIFHKQNHIISQISMEDKVILRSIMK